MTPPRYGVLPRVAEAATGERSHERGLPPSPPS